MPVSGAEPIEIGEYVLLSRSSLAGFLFKKNKMKKVDKVQVRGYDGSNLLVDVHKKGKKPKKYKVEIDKQNNKYKKVTDN